MQTKLNLILLICYFIVSACSKDKDETPQANTLNHQGEKWKISSVDYTIIEQDLSNPLQSIKNGTLSNAGYFYFDGGAGSFDIKIDKFHKEDFFSISENSDTKITITSISQDAGSNNFSQNVIALSGDILAGNSITMSGSITNQSTSGQFVFTGSFVLDKE